jgi:hypothetical protein
VNILINGRPLTDLCSGVEDFDGFELPPAVVRETQQAANSGGSTTTAQTSAPPSPITLTVEIEGSSLAERTRARDRLLQSLQGLIEIEMPDEFPGRVLRCVLATDTPKVKHYSPLKSMHPFQMIVVPLRSLDGCWLDTEPTIVALTTTPVACPIGSVAVAPRLEVFGASTPVVNPSVAVVSAGGPIVGTMPLVGSLAADQAFEADAEDAVTFRRTAGVRALEVQALGAVNEGLPLLDPADASDAVGLYPSLAVSSASGTPTGRAIYWRAW